MYGECVAQGMGSEALVEQEYRRPVSMKRGDGTPRYVFVTFLMLNDSYLPGALLLAYALRKQNTGADLVCMVTSEIGTDARDALSLLFHHVIQVDAIFVPHRRRQERQDRPYWFTRVNALRLGQDGDLGFNYEKVVSLDADLLPLEHYDHLFTVSAPAGIINESKAFVMEVDAAGQYIVPADVEQTGRWVWHRHYGEVCPHGHAIPKEITDRVRADATNLGLNGSLFVLEPSMLEFGEILSDLARPEIARLVGDLFEWPDMQYLTMRWSGRWTSIDLRFSGFNGYPRLSVLFGTHYAGFKPWSFRKAQAMARWSRHEDFQLWFREYAEMVTSAYPRLRQVKQLDRLWRQIAAMAVPRTDGPGPKSTRSSRREPRWH